MRRNANGLFWVVFALVYISLVALFGWQTWLFINFLFPSDQLLAKFLTLGSFDVMAAVWGATDLFYSFASHGAKMLARTAWAITFVLSLAASVLYMALQWFFRLHVTLSGDMLWWGYAVSLVAVTFNVLAVIFFWYLEIGARFGHKDEIDHYESVRNAQKRAREGATVRQNDAPMVGSPKDASRSLQAQIEKLREEGYSMQDIADAVGRNASTVSRRLNH